MRISLLGLGLLSVVGLAACNDPGRGPMQQTSYNQPVYAQPGYGQPAYGQPGYGQPASVVGNGITGYGASTTVETTTTSQPGAIIRDPFVGDWAGVLPSGAPVRVVIPSNGVTPMYYFRGEPQPMGMTEMRGQTMRVNFAPAGNGYLELTPQSDGRMVYFFNSNQTTAQLVLSRAS